MTAGSVLDTRANPTLHQRIIQQGKPQGGGPVIPPARIVSLRVMVGTEFEARVEQFTGVSGKLSLERGSLKVTRDVRDDGGRGCAFSGKVEPEKIITLEPTLIFGFSISYLCVFSRHKEIEPFLKAQAEEDARNPREATSRSFRNAGLNDDGTPPAKSAEKTGGPAAPSPLPQNE